MTQTTLPKAYSAPFTDGWNEALEEAATICESREKHCRMMEQKERFAEFKEQWKVEGNNAEMLAKLIRAEKKL